MLVQGARGGEAIAFPEQDSFASAALATTSISTNADGVRILRCSPGETEWASSNGPALFLQ
jgi:hypothetical protein